MSEEVKFSSSTTIYNAIITFFLALFTYYVVMPITKLLLIHFIKCKLLSRRSELPTYGSWAVVTGATDGIGKAYCEALANDGLNIVLISRSLPKLEETSKSIEKEYSVKTKVISADFTKPDIYEEISKKLEGLDIGVLVNNVGMSYSHPEYIDRLDPHLGMDMINCNVLSTVSMSRLILPQMVARGQGGAVINISSASGAHYVPLLTIYSASKAFVDFFSRAVSYEMAPQGILVQTVLPFFVATKMSKIRRPSFMVPSPQSYVESALNLLGVESRTYGCFAHSLQGLIVDNMPEGLRAYITWNNVAGLRKKALKRAEKRD